MEMIIIKGLIWRLGERWLSAGDQMNARGRQSGSQIIRHVLLCIAEHVQYYSIAWAMGIVRSKKSHRKSFGFLNFKSKPRTDQTVCCRWTSIGVTQKLYTFSKWIFWMLPKKHHVNASNPIKRPASGTKERSTITTKGWENTAQRRKRRSRSLPAYASTPHRAPCRVFLSNFLCVWDWSVQCTRDRLYCRCSE